MRIFVCLILSVLGTFSATLSQIVTVDETKATVTFLFVDDDVEGSLSEFDFTGRIDLDNPGNSVFSGSVVMETLDTDNWLRNRHLRSKKYFNNKEFPKLFFKSNSVSGSGNEFVVEGELTIKGIQKPVSFTFTKLPGKLRGTSVINASDFDIRIHDDPERNMVNVTLTLPYSVD